MASNANDFDGGGGMTTVTCNTDGCENADEPIEIATPADGEVLVVMCGVCGVEIADIADSPDVD